MDREAVAPVAPPVVELLDLGHSQVAGELAVELGILGVITRGFAAAVEVDLVPVVGELERKFGVELEQVCIGHGPGFLLLKWCFAQRAAS